MKIFYTLLLTVATYLSVSAQISHAPNPLAMTAPLDSLDTKLYIYYTNSQDTTYKIYWKLIKDTSTWETGWQTYICDLNLCYNKNVDMSSPTQGNVFGMGTHKFEFHFLPNGIPGCTIIGMELYSDKNFTQKIYSTSININNCISSSKDISSNNSGLKVFPNPVSEYFQVANSNNINKVVLYNLFGKEVKTFIHYNNAIHEIGDPKPGMYHVKLLDSKNKVVKTVKMTKNAGGV